MPKKLKLLKKPLFQKRRWSCGFTPRKTPVALKHRAISRQEKMAFSTPVGLPWDSPPPPTESVRTDGRTDVRMYGRTDVRTDGHVTITSQPKFLGLIGYHGCVLLGLFRNRNTRKRRYLCSFGSYCVFGMNGISFRSFCSR